MENQNINEDEIDLIQIAKTIWKSRKFIVVISAFFVLAGITLALLSPIVYTSSSTFILSGASDDKSSSFGGVASLVGINLGAMSSQSEIPATMYPKVGESVEFKRLLLEEFVDEDKTIRLKKFLIDYHNTDSEDFDTNDNVFFVSEGEDKLFEILDEIVLISVNDKDGFVSISANMPTSEYAANTCFNARKILQNIIINNKIKSANENLNFTKEQLSLKKIEFEKQIFALI